MFNNLDSILHSQTRLAIISILMGVEEAEFTALKEITKVSAGNLSLQLDKLEYKYFSQILDKIEDFTYMTVEIVA